jgi:hypothetical protein
VKVKEGTTFGKFGVIPPTHFLPESQKKEVGRRGVKSKRRYNFRKVQGYPSHFFPGTQKKEEGRLW